MNGQQNVAGVLLPIHDGMSQADGTSTTIGNRYDIKMSYNLTPSLMQSSHDLVVF